MMPSGSASGMLPLLPATPRRADTAAHWAGSSGEWDPRARPADERLMDHLDVLASHGQHVDSQRMIAELRAELRRTDEMLHGLRYNEQVEASRAQVNEQELRRQERTVGQQVAILQNEIAEQQHSAKVAAAAARDAALRQAQLLRRNAAAEITEERTRHAAEMVELRAEMETVREIQAAQADALAASELQTQSTLSKLAEVREELAKEQQHAGQQAQHASAECARLANEGKVAQERQRTIQVASIEREKQTRAMLVRLEAEHTRSQAELAEARGQVESEVSRMRAERSAERGQLEAEKLLRAEQAREEAEWQQKKNEGVLKTITEYKQKIVNLEATAQSHSEARERSENSLESMLELHVEAENAW